MRVQVRQREHVIYMENVCVLNNILHSKLSLAQDLTLSTTLGIHLLAMQSGECDSKLLINASNLN